MNKTLLTIMAALAALLIGFAPEATAGDCERGGEKGSCGSCAKQGAGGYGGPHGKGRGSSDRGHDPAFAQDHEVFFYLLDNREQIERRVEELSNGIETVTESDDPAVAAKIREHVEAMYGRLEENRPIHMRDPLFREICANTDKIQMESEPTEKGVRVVETSSDPYVAKLIQEHARVVSAFIENGRPELRRNHPVPSRDALEADSVN